LIFRRESREVHLELHKTNLSTFCTMRPKNIPASNPATVHANAKLINSIDALLAGGVNLAEQQTRPEQLKRKENTVYQ